MFNENHFTKEAYEDNGRFQIHPLSSEGLEAYLSKDSYNYHFLKSKYDPALLKQIQQEYMEEKENKMQKIKNQNVDIKNNNPTQKIEDIKVQNNPPLNQNNNDIKNDVKKNMGGKECTGVNKGKKKGCNTINKKNFNHNNNMNVGGNVKNSANPVICNIGNGRGKLKDCQQPFHS